LPLQVVQAVRKVLGDDRLLLYRLGAQDYESGGLTAQEGRQVAKALVAAGVDLLDVSAGLGNPPSGWDDMPQGYFLPLAADIRAEVDVPVVVAGGIVDPRFADRVIRDGTVDLIAVGRGMLTNPEWAAEARKALTARKRSK
jgi:NADPH2 dehydrogenase